MAVHGQRYGRNLNLVMVNYSLSVVSLNVDGMRDPKRRSLIFDYLNRYEYDIALLQDTRILNNRECMQWNAKCRCRGFWSVGTVHSWGVGILIRDPAKFEGISFDVDFDGRVCVCDLTFNGTPLRVVNIYAPTVGTDRLNFLSQLDKYLLTCRKVIMGEDFNLVLDIAMDRFGGNPHGSIGSPELKRLLSKYHFIDIWRHQHPSLKTCTWSNADCSIMSLGKFYISVDLVDDSKIVTGIQPCHLSDHDLVSFHIFDTHHILTWGRGVWKMNTSLLKHEKLRTEIISFWSDWTEAKMLFSDVGEWWDEGKAEIKHIIIEYSKAVRQQINEQRVHLMNKFHRLLEKTNLSPHELEQLQRVRSDLCELASQRLEGAKIRSRVTIIRNNEKPSRFFFQRERYNASKKLVTALKTVNGRVTDSDGIMKEQVRFYKNLYTAQLVDTRAQEELLLSIDRKLSEEEKLTLGLPKEFYVCFWETLKSDFVLMVNSCLDKGELPLSLRRAVITLLFKKEDTENLKNWRPISLLNADYKLIAKVISQRLRAVMPSLIHPDQSCAVPGRSSEDNATLLRDISDYVQSNNLKCAFIAIDQEKALDYVDWGFMHKVLARMNFGPIIRGIIKCLYTRVQSAILSNGTLSEFFDIHRGVR